MRRLPQLALLALLGSAADAGRVVGLDQVPPGSKCEQSAVLNAFIGQSASTELAAQMMAAARAPKLRWVAAGAPLAQDHSPRRLTVQLNAENRVLSMTCG